MNIKPYISVKSDTNGLYFYHYLHIHGGAGDNGRGKHRNGGEFDYILFYAFPDDMDGCDICYRKWCDLKGIPYAEGSTIEEAHKKYIKMIAKNPLRCG